MELANFLLEDYRQKVSYLTAHLQRMWTRFNFFLTIQSGLLAFLFTSNRDLSHVALYFALAEAVVALLWYVFGAQDRYLVLLYRQHVKDAAIAAIEIARTLDAGVVVCVFPDRGDKYMTTRVWEFEEDFAQ